MLDKFQGRRTPPPGNVGSDRRSPTAGPSDIARPNSLAQVADSPHQGPDVAPGPSMATHVPPASGPSHHDAPSSGDFASARVVEGDWEPVRAWSRRVSSPGRLRDELELIHTKITQHREIIDFIRARGMFLQITIIVIWTFSTQSMISLARLLLSHVRLSHPVAVGILQTSFLQLRLPVLHVQILRNARGFACHLSLALLIWRSTIRFSRSSSPTRRLKRSFPSK